MSGSTYSVYIVTKPFGAYGTGNVVPAANLGAAVIAANRGSLAGPIQVSGTGGAISTGSGTTGSTPTVSGATGTTTTTGTSTGTGAGLTAAQLAAIANEPADAAAIAALQAKLATSGAPTPAATVRGTYSASGTISVSDDVSEVNSAVPVTMTLAPDTVDNRLHVISQAGPGAVTLTAPIDGVSQSVSLNSTGSLRDSITLRWLADLSTYKPE